MTIDHSTCLWLVQEPRTLYQSTDPLPKTKQVTVQSTVYPPLKTNPGAGTWRRIPWINLRGFWLEQAGFEIGTQYTIEVYDKKLVFTAV
jgi:hypothetical protein